MYGILVYYENIVKDSGNRMYENVRLKVEIDLNEEDSFDNILLYSIILLVKNFNKVIENIQVSKLFVLSTSLRKTNSL